MKKIWVLMVVVSCMTGYGVEISDKLLKAMMQVESRGNSGVKGDYSKKLKEYRAIGVYQIWKSYVDDVNRISKDKKFTYQDRYDKKKSEEMVKIYLEYYGKRYERLTGKKVTDEILAKIHNGGPNGWKNKNTDKYWLKVKKEMR